MPSRRRKRKPSIPKLDPPDGYESWLDFAIRLSDTFMLGDGVPECCGSMTVDAVIAQMKKELEDILDDVDGG